MQEVLAREESSSACIPSHGAQELCGSALGVSPSFCEPGECMRDFHNVGRNGIMSAAFSLDDAETETTASLTTLPPSGPAESRNFQEEAVKYDIGSPLGGGVNQPTQFAAENFGTKYNRGSITTHSVTNDSDSTGAPGTDATINADTGASCGGQGLPLTSHRLVYNADEADGISGGGEGVLRYPVADTVEELFSDTKITSAVAADHECPVMMGDVLSIDDWLDATDALLLKQSNAEGGGVAVDTASSGAST